MRCILAALLIACLPEARAETVAERVASPELGAARPAETITLQERVQDTPGAHEGHRIATGRAPLAVQTDPLYSVSYQACLEPEQHGRTGDVLAREGLSGLGLVLPTGAGWYGGGCIDVLVDGKGWPIRTGFTTLD